MHENYVLAIVKIMDKKFLISSIYIYEPDHENLEFYMHLEEQINEAYSENIVIGGNWNLVHKFLLDYTNYKHYNNTKAKEQVESLIIIIIITDAHTEGERIVVVKS